METKICRQPVLSVETAVSRYERVSGGLSASVITVGLLSLTLVVVWSWIGDSNRIVPNFITPAPEGTLKPLGFAEDIEEPGSDEFPEVTEPLLAEALETVDIPSTVKANDSLGGDQVAMGHGANGLGDKRGIGVVEFPSKFDSQPWKRWEIHFGVTTIGEYAKQLDQFDIELAGVAKKGDSVVYCTSVSGDKTLRHDIKKNEKRIYFRHTKPILRHWDLVLLQQAGVADVKERFPVQIYPVQVVGKLYDLESKRIDADGRQAIEIKKTIFEIVSEDGKYQIVLKDVTYL